MKKIGIITGGGDCGGLNAVVKGAAQMGHSIGIKSLYLVLHKIITLENNLNGS